MTEVPASCRSRLRPRWVLGAVLVFAGTGAGMAHADQAPTPRAPFRVGTDLITVDVSVLDDDRRPVRGLTADDFTVFEDGVPRPIVAFSTVAVPTAEGVADGGVGRLESADDVTSNDLSAEGRLVVILLDRSIPSGAPVTVARDIALAAVDQLGPGDVAAVVRSSGFANNGRVQGFTADPGLLAAAIDSTFTGMTSMELNPSPFPGTDPSTTDCHCGLCVFETLGNVAAAMADAPRRRKLLLFVGSSITMPLPVATDECYSVVRGPRERVMRALEMANVTVHAIDPSGVLPTSPRAGFVVPDGAVLSPAPIRPTPAQLNVQRVDALRVLPDLTGGRLVTNTNAPADHLPAIFEESRLYYLLGFEPMAEPDGMFHRIDVQVHRRDSSLRARSGYVMTTAADATPDEAATSVSELVGALQAPMPRQHLSVSTSVVRFPSDPAQSSPVAVLIRARLPAGDYPRRVALAAAAFDVRGMAVETHIRTIEVASPGPDDTLDGLVMRLDLERGQYEVRVAARDEQSGAIGSVYSFVDVPAGDTEPVALSGIVLRAAGSPTAAGSASADGLLPFVPTLSRRFAPSDRPSAFVRVARGGKPDPVRMRVSILDAAGNVQFEDETALAAAAFADGAADFVVPLAFEHLPPGAYVLRIHGTVGDATAMRQIRFELQGARLNLSG